MEKIIVLRKKNRVFRKTIIFSILLKNVVFRKKLSFSRKNGRSPENDIFLHLCDLQPLRVCLYHLTRFEYEWGFGPLWHRSVQRAIAVIISAYSKIRLKSALWKVYTPNSRFGILMVSYGFSALIAWLFLHILVRQRPDPTRPPRKWSQKTTIFHCFKPKIIYFQKRWWKLADSCRGNPEKIANFYAASSSPSVHFVVWLHCSILFRAEW